MISYWYFVAIAGCLGLSAFCSASETAYSAANRMRLENAMESGNNRARAACYILDRFDDVLSVLLFGNKVADMSASSVVTIVAILLAGGSEKYTAAASVILLLLGIVFGDAIPKLVAKKNANRFAINVSYILKTLMIVMKPFVSLVVFLTNVLTIPLKGEDESRGQDALDELTSIIETVEDEGVIDEERSELLQAALDFHEISASEVMTARVDVLALDIDDDWEELLDEVDDSSYTRLPVYEDSIDNIIGILSLNHFFKARVESGYVDIRSLLMEPCYVYKTQRLPAILSEMQRKKTQMAIVTDEYGGMMGILTIEDVLEQIVGDIWDETDDAEPELIEHGDGVYEIDGDMTIGDFLEVIERDEDSFETDSATVGGWTLEVFEKFPDAGESFEAENMSVTVLEMDGLRVEKVLIRMLNEDRD